MKTQKYNTHSNVPIKKGQKFTMPSLTIQGETLTIQQLFQRAALQGNFVLEDKTAMYLDVPDLEEIDSMYKQGHDLTEMAAFADRIKELNAKVQEHQKQKLKTATEAEKEALKIATIKAYNDELNDKKGEETSE